MFVPKPSAWSASTLDCVWCRAIVAVTTSIPFLRIRPTSRSPSGASVTVASFFGCPKISRPDASAPSLST